jgi:transcriptional regulator with XRE-family HTH domain
MLIPMHENRLTPNQMVAHNLRLAREGRELTQEQAAELLEPFLGERWSVAVFSAAERSIAGKRVREFDADTIHAFARAFGLPIGFFFLPPDGDAVVGLDGASVSPAEAPEQIALSSFVFDALRERIDELSRQLPPHQRAQIMRRFATDPGGISENAVLRGFAEELKAQAETIEALLAGRGDS